jgi:crotonobetainyl-CoA:carnitine CoA-transferase CaiB-like acyl-CoA transferase
MPGPLEGIRVLEVANWLAVPGCGALLTDLGAQTIKVEPPGGDAWRGFRLDTRGWDNPPPGNPMFEVDNRGKRSIAVNLDHPDGRAVVHRLAQDADIFLTNLVVGRRQRYGLTYPELAADNQRLIYLSFSGYGDEGPDRDRLGFDYAGFWSRSGILGSIGDPGLPPPMPRTGMGDHVTAPLLLAGVLAALYERDRSGVGQQVSTSLLNSGMWVLASDLQATAMTRQEPRRTSRAEAMNPLLNTYQAGDGLWFMLVMAAPDPYWPKMCAALARPDLERDPRFGAIKDRTANAAALVAEFETAFAAHPRDEWGRRFDAHGLIWAPVQRMMDVVDDPQVAANGYFTEVRDHPVYGTFPTINTPLKFSRSEVGPKGPAPEVGQHTEEVLLEAGYGWEDIGRLRETGAAGV